MWLMATQFRGLRGHGMEQQEHSPAVAARHSAPARGSSGASRADKRREHAEAVRRCVLLFLRFYFDMQTLVCRARTTHGRVRLNKDWRRARAASLRLMRYSVSREAFGIVRRRARAWLQ